jgi:transcriptional regulator with XRE-family HTH domain
MIVSIVSIIEELQKEQGIRWKELARQSGVSVNTIHNWKQRRGSPSMDGVEQVLEVLGYELEVIKK